MFKRIITLIFLIVPLAIGFYLWNNTQNILRNYVSVPGLFLVKTECDSDGCSTTPYVTFTTKDGSGQLFYPIDVNMAHLDVFSSFYDQAAYHDGQNVTVLYDPHNPDTAYISAFWHFWFGPIFWFILGGLIWLFNILAFLNRLNKRFRQNQMSLLSN